MSTVRIMPLGDSITLGFTDETHGGYREPLHWRLANAGYSTIFVGGLPAPDDPPEPFPDHQHEGHAGRTAGYIQAQVFDWLKANPADFVLLHIGTNDINIIANATPPLTHTEVTQRVNGIPDLIMGILDEIERFGKTQPTPITVILARIVNRANPYDLFGTETTRLNQMIGTRAAARIASGHRLVVADFEHALVYPADISDPDKPNAVHPNKTGYCKMAPVWFAALNPLLWNRIIPAGGYTLDILTGLAVSNEGVLEMTSVVDVEHWKPLTPISDPVFTPGAPVALAKQTDGILTALAVDKFGRMVVASVPGAGVWQPPVGISEAIFLPATPVAMAKQTDGILTALAVDRDGRLVVASVAGLGPWKKPKDISEPIFFPATPVAMAKQTDGILTALAVDKTGRLMVSSVAGLGPWKAPFAISGTIFNPGSPVAMAKQTDGVLTALAVDALGRLVVMSVPGVGHWQAPFAISGPVFPPGAPVAMAKQTDGILTALAVDTTGRLRVASVPSLGQWQAPVGISGPIFKPGTWVAMAKQNKDLLTAIAVDLQGRLVVTSVPGLDQWQEPVGISSAIFPAGAPVALAKEIDDGNLSALIRGRPEFSGSRFTQRVGQLTGTGTDVEYLHLGGNQKQVFNDTAAHGVKGVDLGTNMEFEGKLMFFFGDVPTVYKQYDDQGDWVAYTSNRTEPWFGFPLSSVDVPGTSAFKPYSVKGIGPLGLAQTPTGAFSYPGKDSGGTKEQAYVFAFYNPGDSPPPAVPAGAMLTKSADPTQPNEFERLFSFSWLQYQGKFFQVAPWVVDHAKFPGLFPLSTGDGLVMLGHGSPTNSVHVGWMPLFKGLDPDPASMQYYTGNAAEKNWSPIETKAKTLFSTIAYTSLSLAWMPEMKRWLLLYTLASPGSIPIHYDPANPTQHNPNGPVVARVGITPWDWSDEIIIFDPIRDNALGRFMHRPGPHGRNGKDGDELNNVEPVIWPDYEQAYGGLASYAYGAFLLNRYTKWDAAARDLTIYYLMSTFRPYQVHIMCSHFTVPESHRRTRTIATGP